MKQMIYIAGITFCVLFSTSCFNTMKPVEKVETKPVKKPPQKPVEETIIADKLTKQRIKIKDLKSEFLPTGLIKAHASAKNTSDKPFKFSYKFIWLDKEGKQLDTPSTTWKEQDIMGGGTAKLSAVAPNMKAVGYRLKLRSME